MKSNKKINININKTALMKCHSSQCISASFHVVFRSVCLYSWVAAAVTLREFVPKFSDAVKILPQVVFGHQNLQISHQ